MNTQRTKEVSIQNRTGTISGKLSSAVIAFLVLLVQVLLPIAPAFAAEDAPASEAVDATSESIVAAETVTTEDPPIDTLSPKTGEIVSEEATPQVDGDVTNEIAEPPTEDMPDETIPDLGLENDAATSTEEVTTTDVVEIPSDIPAETTDTETQPEENIPPPEVIDEEDVPVSSTDTETETTDELTDATEASTTLEQTVVPPEVHMVTNDANRFTFGIDDCAQVADGSFYCRSKQEVVTPITTDRVFAGPDIDGDNEIYIERNGEVTQITQNLVDDGAPFYDALTETIVWHRLVDARYQIVSYDLETGEEKVLTNDHYNNMQPSRAGDITVWQGWVGNDWEILSMVDGEIVMLTDNTFHDIGPRINGDYVIWQADEADGWKVRVYDRLTKRTETIADSDGASIENPRFVLLYDAKQENGDIETRGYDLESGKNVPLSAQPHSIPDEIPDPDQTGEDRALIVGTTQLKTKTEDDLEPDTDTVDQPVPQTTGTTTSDVVIPAFDPVEQVGDNSSTYGTTTTADLVVEPLHEENTSVDIPDLIVLPYTQPRVEEVDSQGEVATTS